MAVKPKNWSDLARKDNPWSRPSNNAPTSWRGSTSPKQNSYIRQSSPWTKQGERSVPQTSRGVSSDLNIPQTNYLKSPASYRGGIFAGPLGEPRNQAPISTDPLAPYYGWKTNFKKPITPPSDKTPLDLDDKEEPTDKEKEANAISQASVRSQELKADYDAIQRQLQFQRNLLEQGGSLRRAEIEDLAESERIRQRLAMIGAGTGGSGLGSQLAQKTAIKRFNTLREFQREYQAKIQQNQMTQEVEKRRFYAKLKADQAYLDALNKDNVGDDDNSISISRASVNAFIESVKGSELDNPNYIGRSIVERYLYKNIKDNNRREELEEKWSPFYKDIANFFMGPNAPKQGELNFNKKTGELTYYSSSSGWLETVNIEKENGRYVWKNQGGNITTQELKRTLLGIDNNISVNSMKRYINSTGAADGVDQTILNKLNQPNFLSRFVVQVLTKELYSKYVKGTAKKQNINNFKKILNNLSSGLNNRNNAQVMYRYLRNFYKNGKAF